MFTVMKTRSALIKEIAQYGLEYHQSKLDIQEYPWDCESELYLLTKADVLSVFNRFLFNELTSEQLFHWATFLECRDDFGYEAKDENLLSEIIFLLGNPEINYPINEELITELQDRVWSSKHNKNLKQDC